MPNTHVESERIYRDENTGLDSWDALLYYWQNAHVDAWMEAAGRY